MAQTKQPYHSTIEEITEQFETNVQSGLTNEQAQSRLEHYGHNEIVEEESRTLWQKFIDQFKDFMIVVLLIALSLIHI